MPLPNNIRAIIFDMDGLLIDSERISRAAWMRVFQEWNYPFEPAIYGQVIGRNVAGTLNVFTARYGPDFPFEAMYQRKWELMQAEIAAHGLPLKLGAVAMLDWVDDLGLPKALASSSARRLITEKLNLTGLQDRFSLSVAGDEVEHGKPAPDIFFKAAQLLRVEPTECCVFEDSAMGIQAAHAAGMIPFMVPDVNVPSAETAAIAAEIFPSLHEAGDYLKQAVQGLRKPSENHQFGLSKSTSTRSVCVTPVAANGDKKDYTHVR